MQLETFLQFHFIRKVILSINLEFVQGSQLSNEDRTYETVSLYSFKAVVILLLIIFYLHSVI